MKITKHEEAKSTKKQKKRKADTAESTEEDTVPETAKPSNRHVLEPPASPPKKKRKTTTDIIPAVTSAPATKKAKSKPAHPNVTKSTQKPNFKPTPAPGSTDESPEIIADLQAQVKDIIKSASSLAKAARARALSGGDDDDGEGKPSMKRKKKTTGAKVKPLK